VPGYADEGDLPNLVTAFVQRCKSQGIESTSINVLVRSKELLNVILPGTVPSDVYPWVVDAPLARLFAHARYLRENGLHADALRIVERALYQAEHPDMKGSPTFRELYPSTGDLKRRGQLLALLDQMPSTSGAILGAWTATAAQTFEKLQLPYPLRIKKKSTVCNYATLTFRDVFGPGDGDVAGRGFKLQTVHAAKGQSLDAVPLILKRKAGRSKLYVNLLGQTITESEELRIVYVGVTRAKRILEIAVPAQDATTWQEYLGPVASNGAGTGPTAAS